MNANETTQTASVIRDPAAWQRLADELRPYVELCAVGEFNENDLPANVEWYLQRCRIRSHKPSDPLNVPATDENLVRYNGKDYYLRPDSDAVHRGEPNPNKVPYYVHVAAVDGRVVELQYYFFYPYNGPVPLFCDRSFLAKPIGAHEGDWEGIRLRVDVDARAIVEVYLATHGDQGIPLRHSTEGAGDPTHYRVIGKRPVVYSAFHSHASYPDIAKHTRYKGLTCDRCTGGRRWDGPAVVVSIDPDLLASKTTYPEPVWLNWTGRWGATVQAVNLDDPTSWTSNSPDGPKISSSWTPGRGTGTWGVWAQVAPGGAPRLGEYFTPSATVLGNWPLIGCVESSEQGPDNQVWVAHRSPDWRFSRVGAVPAGKNVQLVRFAVAAEGRVMAFAQDEPGLLYWTAQQPGGSFDRWDDWVPLAGSELRAIEGAFDVNTDDDGFVHVLVPSEDGHLYDIVYASGGSRPGWLPARAAVSLSGSGSGSVVTEHSRNGTLVAVYAFAGQICFLTWSRSGWTPECSVFPQRGPEFLVQSLTRSASGSLYVFALAKSGARWHIQYSHEVAPGQWSPWGSIKDAPPVVSVRAIAEANGRIAVLAQVTSGKVMMTRQNKEGGDWVAWSEIGQSISILGQPFRNADGRLEAVATRVDSEKLRFDLYHNYESSPYY